MRLLHRGFSNSVAWRGVEERRAELSGGRRQDMTEQATWTWVQYAHMTRRQDADRRLVKLRSLHYRGIESAVQIVEQICRNGRGKMRRGASE